MLVLWVFGVLRMGSSTIATVAGAGFAVVGLGGGM